MQRQDPGAVGGLTLLAQTGGSFAPQGPVAREMAELWWVMLVLGVAVFAVFVVALGLALFRRSTSTDTPADEASPTINRWIIGGGVVMPALVVMVIFGFTLQSMRAIPDKGGPESVVIEVVGHQWWWEARYPDHDVVTANEIHIPVGRSIELRLTSADVIHSFWVPPLAGKIDLMPEDTNTLVLQADEPGEYRGQCAEFCGLQHAKMQFLVIAESPEDFDAWVAGQQDVAADPADEVTSRGHDLFLGGECVKCHTIRGTAADGDEAPDLTHFASRRTIGAVTLANTQENVSAWVDDPHQFKNGIEMEGADLPPDDMAALVQYLESLQ